MPATRDATKPGGERDRDLPGRALARLFLQLKIKPGRDK